MYGFVVLEGFIFGEKSTSVLDPGEEKLSSEFEKVKSSFIPIHSVVRIDQVERKGVAKIVSENQGDKSIVKVSTLYVPEKK